MFTPSRRHVGGPGGWPGPVLLLVALLLPGVGARAASLSLEAGPVVLGRVKSVGVTLRVEEPPGAEGRPLRLSVNVGGFGPVTRVGSGVYRSEYRPPSTRFPQVALVAVWHETGPEAPIHFLRLPLYGSTKLRLEAPEWAQVQVAVGLDTFGPVRADRRGRVEVPLTVPPLVGAAQVFVTDMSGRVRRDAVPVATPGYNRLTLAAVPHAVSVDGSDWARVEVFYDAQRELRPEDVTLTASVGHAELVRREEGGRLVYRYVAPAGTPEGEVEFRATVAGDALAQGSARLTLGRPPATQVHVLPPERPLVAGGEQARAPVRVRVLDAQGLGVAGQQVVVTVSGRALPGVTEAGAGEYAVEVPLPAAVPPGGALEVVARVQRTDGRVVTGGARLEVQPLRVPSSVTARFTPERLPADGESRATVTFEVRGADGQPLSGLGLALAGSGLQVGEVEEVGGGQYRAVLTAPQGVPAAGPALLRLADASGRYAEDFPVPLREPRRLLLGLRGGGFDGLTRRGMAARGGGEVWATFSLGGAPLGVGLSATYARVTQAVVDRAGGVVRDVSAHLVPVSFRVGHGMVVTPDFGLYTGVGGTVALARMRTGPDAGTNAVGLGGLAFLSAAFTAGPGQLFTELTYGYAPVMGLEAGGAGLELGYRLAVF